VLLFRGANKEIKNYNSQSPFQVKQKYPFSLPPRNICEKISCELGFLEKLHCTRLKTAVE